MSPTDDTASRQAGAPAQTGEPADNTKTDRDFRKRIEHFRRRQLRTRKWICFEEIAEAFAEFYAQGGVLNEEMRTRVYNLLTRDLRDGEFEEHGRSRVLFLHPWHVRSRTWMTREWLASIIEQYPPPSPDADERHRRAANTLRSQFLDHCWIPRRMFDRWLVKHFLPALPRFTPTEPARRPAVVHPVAQTEEVQARRKAARPNAKRPGRKPDVSERVKQAMRDDLNSGRHDADSLNALTGKQMCRNYGAKSRETVCRARLAVLSEIDDKLIFDNSSSNDN
jgi:hypothetical protein